MSDDKIVAVGLLTQTNLRMLGSSLKKVIPVTDDDRFVEILRDLDEMERKNASMSGGNTE